MIVNGQQNRNEFVTRPGSTGQDLEVDVIREGSLTDAGLQNRKSFLTVGGWDIDVFSQAAGSENGKKMVIEYGGFRSMSGR